MAKKNGFMSWPENRLTHQKHMIKFIEQHKKRD